MKKLILALALTVYSALGFTQEQAIPLQPEPQESTSVQALDLKTGKVERIDLTKDNSVVLREDFNQLSIGKVIKKLSELDSDEPSDDPIYLTLVTPGGYIDDGLNLYAATQGMNRPVHTITVFAASMGFQTVQNLDKRYILDYGILMSHKAKGGTYGEFGGKGKSQFDSRYNLDKAIVNQLDVKAVERTNGKKTLEQYQDEYENELWLLGSQAVSEGYADEVVKTSCSKELKNSTETIAIPYYFLRIEAYISNCPTDTSLRDIKVLLPTNRGYMTLKEYIDAGGIIHNICSASDGKGKDSSDDSSGDGGLLGALFGSKKEDKDSEKPLCLQHPELMQLLQEAEAEVKGGTMDLVSIYRKNVLPMTFRNSLSVK